MDIKLHQQCNGSWVALTVTSSGSTVSVLAPSPGDACLEILERLGMDHLASYLAALKEREQQRVQLYDSLLEEYNSLLKTVSVLHRHMKDYRLSDDHDRKKIIDTICNLLQSWPPLPGNGN